jgi:hypothetical protein
MWSIILGALIAIGTTIAVEYLRRPQLELSIATAIDLTYAAGERPATSSRYLLVSCTNKPLPRLARWMSRNAALQCHGSVTFHHLDGQNFFGRSMPLRWSGSEEPLPLQIVMGAQTGMIVDPSRMSVDSRLDIHVGDSGKVDTAVKFNNEPECYGWCNLNYFSNPQWRNPDWKIPPGRYLVKVVVVSADQRCEGVFRLINDVAQQDFRLEPRQPQDPLV